MTLPATMIAGLGRLAQWPLRMLTPPVCVGCDAIIDEPGTLCPACWARVKFLERPWCAVLGTPFAHDLGDAAVSPEAIADPPDFDRARSAVVHEGVARRMVQSLKYGDRGDLAPGMARWMARAGTELLADADVIMAVPLHWRRLFSRRYNQSAELARALARQTGHRFVSGALVRVKATDHQVGLNATQRRDNVRGAFAVTKGLENEVRGRRILLVDDVYTTGATVSAAARALKRKGAAGVDVITFSRAMAGDALS